MKIQQIEMTTLLFVVGILSSIEPIYSHAQDPPPQYGHFLNWRYETAFDPGQRIAARWQVDVGEARSQIVGNDQYVFVASGTSQKNKEAKTVDVTTSISAFHSSNGACAWTYQVKSQFRGEQQTFGGSMATPQSTPAIIGKRLMMLSFTGTLCCLDCETGIERWKKDLVEEFDAVPVQFGFSASLVIDPAEPANVIVLAAGKQGGLLNIKVADGNVNWRSECRSASYATPTSANFGGVPQWLVVTENDVIGIRKIDGQRLWKHDLAKPELTNVPSPLVIDASRLLVSGQGSTGTRCLEITKQGKKWTVAEKWHQPRIEFFYTNWMMLSDRVVVGCTDRFLAAIDVTTGQTVGRWRGYGDGNVLRVGNQMVLLNGSGALSVFSTLQQVKIKGKKQNQLTAIAKLQLPNGRYWVPPTIVNDKMYVRFDDQLLCLENTTKQGSTVLANQMTKSVFLELEPFKQITEPDPVALIFTEFQDHGKAAAFKLYSSLRKAKKLNVEQRVALAEAAGEQALTDLVKLILIHAKEDFPDSAKITEAINQYGM